MIGVGSMGGAILSGLTAPGIRIALPIYVTTQSAASANALAASEGIVARSGEEHPEANREAVRGAKLVILGVKPWLIHEVAREIAADLEPGTVVVSVAAGVTSASIEALLPEGVAVVRAMPNTPSHIGRGMTGIAAGATAGAADLELARALFATVGEVIEVAESQINDVAAVSGSGPAYVFLYAEHMIEAAMRRGFTQDQATLLVQQTLLGSAELLAQSEVGPAQLRRNVTSPKGTTERAIEVLQGDDWGGLFDRALAANVQRSEELEGA